MSNLEQQCNNLLMQAQSLLLQDRYESAYTTIFQVLPLVDTHYRDAPLYRKIEAAVCYRIFKAYLFGVMGLIRMRENAHETALEPLLKGLQLFPHDILLQRLVLVSLKLNLVSDAHRYLRMLYHPSLVDDTVLLSLPKDLHIPAAEVHALEAMLYVHLRNVDHAISSCIAGLSLLAEESQQYILKSQNDSNSSENCEEYDGLEMDSGTPFKASFRRRLCVHYLSLCEVMKLAAEQATGTPYMVTGSFELVLKTLLQSFPNGVIEGNRITNFSQLSSVAFMAFLDNGGDPTMPGRGLDFMEVLISIFSYNFKYACDLSSLPIKCAPFLSTSMFLENAWTSLAHYSEAYKKAIISRGVALLDRRYLVIKSSTLSEYIEQTYGLLHQSTTSARLQRDDSANTPYDHTVTDVTRQPDDDVNVLASAAKTANKILGMKASRLSKLQSKSAYTHSAKNNLLKTTTRIASVSTTRASRPTDDHDKTIKHMMNNVGNTPVKQNPNAVLPIAARNSKDPQRELSFLPHATPRSAQPIREIDAVTQITLECTEPLDETVDSPSKVYNLYTNNISTCHECSYSTPTFASRKLRDEVDISELVDFNNKFRDENTFRDKSLGRLYKRELKKSMTGMLRERMFLEFVLERVEKGEIEDFSFLRIENLHKIDRRILYDGSIATPNPQEERGHDSLDLRDARCPRILSSVVSTHSAQTEKSRMEKSIRDAQRGEDMVPGNTCLSTSDSGSPALCPSTVNYSVRDYSIAESMRSTYTHTQGRDDHLLPKKSISKKHINKLVAKSSKKARISSNKAYQSLIQESRLYTALGIPDTNSSDDLNEEELIREGCKLYIFEASTNSPSPEPIVLHSDSHSPELPSRVPTKLAASETSALAMSILNTMDDANKVRQPQDFIGMTDRISICSTYPQQTDAPINKTPNHSQSLCQSALSVVPKRSFKHATDEFYSVIPPTSNNGQYFASTQATRTPFTARPADLVQGTKSFGYLVDSHHVQDTPGAEITSVHQSALQSAGSLISTVRASCSDALFKKITLDESVHDINLNMTTKSDMNASMLPSYRGTMRVSVNLTQEKAKYPVQTLPSMHFNDVIPYTTLPYASPPIPAPDHDHFDAASPSQATYEVMKVYSPHNSNLDASLDTLSTLPPPSSTGTSETLASIPSLFALNSCAAQSKRATRAIEMLKPSVVRDALTVSSDNSVSISSASATLPAVHMINAFTENQFSKSPLVDFSFDAATAQSGEQSVSKNLRTKRKTMSLEAILTQNTTNMPKNSQKPKPGVVGLSKRRK